MESRTARSLSVRTRLNLLAVIPTVVPLLIFGLITSWQFQKGMGEQVNATLAAEAEAFARTVELSLHERELQVHALAENPVVIGAMAYSTFDKSDAVLALNRTRYPVFKGLALFTPQGEAVSASSPELKARLQSRQDAVRASAWFTAALQDQDPRVGVVQDPLLGGEEAASVIPLAVPVVSAADHSVLGVVMGAYDWSSVARDVKPALDRAVQREQSSFRLVLAEGGGKVLFDSYPQGSTAADLLRRMGTRTGGVVDDWVVASTINQSTMPDAADGWIFVAMLSKREALRVLAQTNLIGLLLGLALALMAVVMAMLVSRRIIGPVNALNKVVDRIVQDGDLTVKISLHSDDEIGQLARSFAQMVQRLRDMSLALQDASKALMEQVTMLTAVTEEQSQAATKQAAALQETQVTANEIRQTSQMAAQKADGVLSVADRADQLGRSGESALAQSASGLGEIRQQADEIAMKIRDLKGRTRQISNITATVKDIADQSNMLALNAAIEAVRSGEHGKGFSVVAREIRSLADQSVQSTNRVGDVLDDVTSAIDGAVAITEKGAQRMEASLGQIKQSSESFRELSTIVKDNAAAVRQIAAAVSQQNAGIAQIFTAVTDLSRIMNEAAKGLESTARSAAEVKLVSERVSGLVKAYRV